MDCLAHAAPAAAQSHWTLFDLVGSGVAVTTADGTVEYCNGALLRLLAKNTQALCGTSIFALLDGGANGALEKLHRAALEADSEMRTQVRSPGRFVAGAVLRRSDSDGDRRVIWSFVDARYNEPVPELALWGTEIGLWDWDVVNDRLTWINDWCEHSQLTAFSGYGHEQLWCSRIHPEDLPAYREAITRHLDGQAPPYDVEYRLRNRGGAWVWIQERGRVIERDSTGRASLPMSGANPPALWSTAKPAWRTRSGDPASAFGTMTLQTTGCIGATIGAPTWTWTPATVQTIPRGGTRSSTRMICRGSAAAMRR